MAIEPQMQRRWEDKLAAYVGASFRAAKLGIIASHAIDLVGKLLTAAVLWVGAGLVIDGRLTVGELVAVNMLLGRVTGPILRLAQVWQEFQQIRVSVARLGDILNAPAEPSYNPNRATPPRKVTFDHVNFRYQPNGRDVLQDIELEVPAGQVLGIVGRSGSGKSTLTRLVQRLFVPSQGRVLIDGVDLALVETSWLRRQIGVVLQENLLFIRSVRENIALADPTAPMDAVVRAAQMAGAHDFILELAEGYDTLIDERGANLSGGQRQRIAIARALMSDPRILIFDEATSALDAESEEIIQRNMQSIVRGRTLIIIAHRLSAVRIAPPLRDPPPRRCPAGAELRLRPTAPLRSSLRRRVWQGRGAAEPLPLRGLTTVPPCSGAAMREAGNPQRWARQASCRIRLPHRLLRRH